jgi:hypothetical protein
MTQTKVAPRAPTFEAVPIPAQFLNHQHNVTLCIDFFLVQGLDFLHTISLGIGFRNVALVTDCTYKTIIKDKEINSVIKLYHDQGLLVRDIHANSQFACKQDVVQPINMDIVTPDTRVGEVERSIRTVKQRIRSCAHGLPFKQLPKLMVQHIVSDAVRYLNQFRRKNDISTTLSPDTIALGVCYPDYATMRVEFGSCVQVFKDSDPTNTPRASSLGAVALSPNANSQGAHHFMSLSTGACISRYRWVDFPTPDTAIARVEALAIADGQLLLKDSGLVVEWRPDHPIDNSENDRDYDPSSNVPSDEELKRADYDPIDASELADLADFPPQDQRAPLGNADENHYDGEHRDQHHIIESEVGGDNNSLNGIINTELGGYDDDDEGISNSNHSRNGKEVLEHKVGNETENEEDIEQGRNFFYDGNVNKAVQQADEAHCTSSHWRQSRPHS